MIPFAVVKGRPAYWHRDDPADLELHRRMIAEREKLVREFRQGKAA